MNVYENKKGVFSVNEWRRETRKRKIDGGGSVGGNIWAVTVSY